MKVIIENYDPQWSILYDELKKELLSLDREDVIKTIEHIGSTSVNELGAKPVIDIMIGTESNEKLDRLPRLFDQPGFNYKKEYEVAMPYRRFFNRIKDNIKIANIHCVVYDHEFRTQDVMFREYLKANPSVRDEYYKFKKELSQYDWETANDYADAKTGFIKRKKEEALRYFTGKTEEAEANALYDIIKNIDESYKKGNNIKCRRYKKAVMACYPPAQIVLFNRVIGAGLHNYINKKDIYYFLDYYKSIEKFAVQLTPVCKPENLGELLDAKGIEEKDYWIRLFRNTDPVEFKNNNEIEIREVTSEQEKEYCDMVQRVFNLPETAGEAVKSSIGRPDYKVYFAVYKGKNIAAASLYIDGDTAWLGMAATLTEYRSKGAQTILINERINAAREAGCRWLSVETACEVWKDGKKNSSYHNLLKNGFIKLYRIKNYIRFE